MTFNIEKAREMAARGISTVDPYSHSATALYLALGEIMRLQKIAIEERCKAIMLIEKLKSVANDPSWENNGMKFNLGHYMEQAAQELQLEATKEAGYVERDEAKKQLAQEYPDIFGDDTDGLC